MVDFRCVTCLLGDDPEEVFSAVTLWCGSAYCLDHLRQAVAADRKRPIDQFFEDDAAESDDPRCLCGHLSNDHSDDTGLCRRCPCLIFASAHREV